MIVEPHEDPSTGPPIRTLAFCEPAELNAASDPNPAVETTTLELVGLDTDRANLVTSQLFADEEHHAPVLDIDFECVLLTSSTGGHHHLYLNGIDPPLTWLEYSKLLDALLEARIIGPGYHRHSINRGYTALRRPHVRKLVTVDHEEPF